MKFLEIIAHPLYALRRIDFIDKVLTFLSKKSLTYIYSVIISVILFLIFRDII